MSETAAGIATRTGTPMIQKDCTMRFLTPAFLGNAEQSGQWRTPPFKALLRQWWRVAVAPEYGYDYRRMRESEGLLFGHAWLEHDKDRKGNKVSGRKSAVRLRVDSWDKGDVSNLSQINGAFYLAYGRIENNGRVENPPAISPGASARLALAFPDQGQFADQLQKSLALIDLFGAVGSRSRNGWGSLKTLTRQP